MLEPDWLPELPLGSEALLPPLLPPGDGVDEPLRPDPDEEDGMPERPEEPELPEDPLEPDDPPLEPGGEELGDEGIEDDC